METAGDPKPKPRHPERLSRDRRAITESARVPLHLCVQGAGAAHRAGEHLVACRLGHPDGRVAAAQPEAGGRFVIAVPVIV
ncbi:hypothetical protein [Streptomyces rubiginosohelvolus]|uniref:hypothetical protein n=1 Tax=Streptomyces rubiginosohelvolus TaxID=67362 RepID=UPI003717F6CE